SRELVCPQLYRSHLFSHSTRRFAHPHGVGETPGGPLVRHHHHDRVGAGRVGGLLAGLAGRPAPPLALFPWAYGRKGGSAVSPVRHVGHRHGRFYAHSLQGVRGGRGRVRTALPPVSRG